MVLECISVTNRSVAVMYRALTLGAKEKGIPVPLVCSDNYTYILKKYQRQVKQ